MLSLQEPQAPYLRQWTRPSSAGIEDSVKVAADPEALANVRERERNWQLNVARQPGFAPEHQFSSPNLHTAQ